MAKEKIESKIATLKLRTLVEDERKLNALCLIKLPIKPAYWLNRVASKVESEMKDFRKTKEELIKRLGKETEKGDWEVTEANMDTFKTEWEKLLDTDIKLDIEKIDIKELGEVSVEPELVLNWIFDIK